MLTSPVSQAETAYTDLTLRQTCRLYSNTIPPSPVRARYLSFAEMFCLKSTIASAFLVASAAAQGVFIASPIANSTFIPGETFVVDVDRPVRTVSPHSEVLY